MKKLALATILATVIAQPVMANNTIFSCVTNKGKHISVTQIGNQYEYSFGKKGKPELVFRNTISQAVSNENTGTETGTGYITTYLSLKNGKHSYVVYEMFDRKAGKISDGGVRVYKGENELADVMCSSSNKIVTNFDYDIIRQHGFFR